MDGQRGLPIVERITRLARETGMSQEVERSVAHDRPCLAILENRSADAALVVNLSKPHDQYLR